ncbi:GntR family transcriptional regulator [Lachnospiraceae bacterium LCP25S3_G4]
MIIIDFQDRRPLYEQIISRFQELILNGVLKPDEKLPSVRSLAIDLSITPNTIQRAYSEMEKNGYIYAIKGRGNFVAPNSSLKEQRIKEVQLQLKTLINTSKNIGLKREMIEQYLDEIYRREIHDSDKSGQ